MNAYVMFLRRNEGSPSPPIQRDASTNATIDNESSGASQSSHCTDGVAEASSKVPPPVRVEVGLVCVCGLADFEAVRVWCSTVSEVRIVLLRRRHSRTDSIPIETRARGVLTGCDRFRDTRKDGIHCGRS